ncbi:MAG: ABC transporter permease subunit [Clostridia bacterium]
MLNNIKNITLFDLKNNKKLIFGWAVSIFGIMFLYMILFPSVQDMAQIKMQAMPEELMRFMGMSDFSDMSNFVSYFAMIYNIILIAISIFAVTFAANLVLKEEKSKTIEFLYSLQVSKIEIYLSKFFVAYIAALFVICSAVVATLICGFINGGETFVFLDVVSIVKLSSITPLIYLSIGSMLAGISGKISGATVGSMIVILSYVLGFLSTMVSESLSWLEYLSPFQVFSPTLALESGIDGLINMCLYCAVMFAFVAIGGALYNKRDFKI